MARTLATCLSIVLALAAGDAAAQTAPSRLTPTTQPVTAAAPRTLTPADSAARDLATCLDRASKLKEDDVDGRMSLARWCRDREMWTQAAEMADQVLYRDPGNRAAYLILQQVDDARALPDDPAAADALKAEFAHRFGHDFATRNTKHFLMCFDTPADLAVKQGTAMEKSYDAFLFYFNFGTLRPDFLDHRLVAVFLAKRDDYVAYGKETEGTDIGWSAGYYSKRTNRFCFFDDSNGINLADLNDQAGTLKQKIDALNKDIAAANLQNQLGMVNTLTVERNRVGETLYALNNEINTKATFYNKNTTMHETAHQIAFNMGIQSRFVDYPPWFSEGLACSFETEDALGHRGPALINYGRIGFLKDAINAGTVPSIADFITAEPPSTADTKAMGLLYAQGWGLFHFLYKYHREGMEQYLLAYKTHAPFRRIGADERRVLFTRAFGGDLDELNKKFLAYFKAAPSRPR